MASLSFSYRSTKPTAFLEVRLSYRVEGENLNPKTGKENPFSFYSRSKIEVEKSYWKIHKKNTNDPVIQKKQNELNTKMTNLRKFVLDRFDKMNIEHVDKDWFLSVLEDYNNPEGKEQKQVEVIPTLLVDYIPYFIKCRKGMKQTSITKYNVIKKKMERMEESLDKKFHIKDINEDFKNLLEDYYTRQRYSQNTMQRELGFIKTVCRHARKKGLDTSKELDDLKFKKEPVRNIYFNEDELRTLENLEGLKPHLDNARDWLVISCHCGQRVSDFLNFRKEMIIKTQGVSIIHFTQKKTGIDMEIALSGKIEEILKKRNGDFPRKISDQKYNDYIKKVCKIAGFNEMTKGKKQINIAKNKDDKKMRAVEGVFPKYELVTSHIGRRTFATLKRDSMPLSLLMSMTGHTTEEALNTYLQKEGEDKALEAAKYL